MPPNELDNIASGHNSKEIADTKLYKIDSENDAFLSQFFSKDTFGGGGGGTNRNTGNESSIQLINLNSNNINLYNDDTIV